MYDDRAEILDITVHINHRNNGIGCELINKVLEICKNNGCKSITLEVRHNNESAVALYKKCGFKTISTRKRYYENGTVDAYLMFREL
jgi:ribosomal-protein-alanine N-acetyltransferase